MEFVFGLDLDLPDIDRQRRIIDILSRAEGISRLRREAEATTKAIAPALFIDMFGDPATNPMGWPITTIGENLVSADYGSSTKATSHGSGLPLIRMGNVKYDGALDLHDLKYVDLPEDERERFRLLPGDILFNRTNSKDLVGKTGLWEGCMEAIVASYFIRLRVDSAVLRPAYLWAYMNGRYMKRRLYETARGAIGQANINSKEVAALTIPLAPLAAQCAFETRLQAIRSVTEQGIDAARIADQAFAALVAQTFGEWT